MAGLRQSLTFWWKLGWIALFWMQSWYKIFPSRWRGSRYFWWLPWLLGKLKVCSSSANLPLSSVSQNCGDQLRQVHGPWSTPTTLIIAEPSSQLYIHSQESSPSLYICKRGFVFYIVSFVLGHKMSLFAGKSKPFQAQNSVSTKLGNLGHGLSHLIKD